MLAGQALRCAAMLAGRSVHQSDVRAQAALPARPPARPPVTMLSRVAAAAARSARSAQAQALRAFATGPAAATQGEVRAA